MPEAPTQAVSSPAEAPDPFNGQTPTVHEWNQYRVTGDVPERFKPAEIVESAPEETPVEGEEPEIAPESTPENEQEVPEGIGNKARRRFEKLLAEKKELERKLAERAKPDVKPEPSPAPQQGAEKEPTVEDKNPDGTFKFKTYEEFTKAQARWEVRQEMAAERQREQQQQEVRRIQDNIEEARKTYGDEFDSIIEPTAGAIMGNNSIPVEVKRMMAQSDVLPELVYTIGTDQKTMKELERLARVNPAQAIRYIATLEVGIRAELAAPAVTPEPRRTAAPKPPSPVTGASSRAFDVSDESLSPEEWARKRNAQVLRRRG